MADGDVNSSDQGPWRDLANSPSRKSPATSQPWDQTAFLSPLQCPQFQIREPQKRIMNLEKSLQFLQQQHSETLVKLHEEIEYLKRENKDLHYRLIMNQKLQKKGSISGSSMPSARTNCKPSSAGPTLLPKTKQAKGPKKPDRKSKDSGKPNPAAVAEEEEEEEERVQSPRPPWHVKAEKATEAGPVWEKEVESPNPTISSVLISQPKLKPSAGASPSLGLPSHLQRLSTMQQCEVAIHQLWNANHLQAQELQHLKSLLDKVCGDKRIANPLLLSGPTKDPEGTQFPKVPVKNTHKKCVILTPLPVAERAVLPALKQTLRNGFAERQKRTQEIQRSRLRRTVL
ncbi:coiled-coil domain-containing protein 74B-like [Tachyglossus aculeatus]|uniref:coiled-coil domain-containing protein 74B-like n=1 Tax=Tachyglossus aculeatus TaxID=9261 RepID=UPI0018F35214|nr:coiled-coil domain-containing protein 74B-like [Tachyglossus aculeatus]